MGEGGGGGDDTNTHTRVHVRGGGNAKQPQCTPPWGKASSELLKHCSETSIKGIAWQAWGGRRKQKKKKRWRKRRETKTEMVVVVGEQRYSEGRNGAGARANTPTRTLGAGCEREVEHNAQRLIKGHTHAHIHTRHADTRACTRTPARRSLGALCHTSLGKASKHTPQGGYGRDPHTRARAHGRRKERK